ncbi:hypothetical protein AAHE18_08G187700 [Arachis hypogaea]
MARRERNMRTIIFRLDRNLPSFNVISPDPTTGGRGGGIEYPPTIPNHPDKDDDTPIWCFYWLQHDGNFNPALLLKKCSDQPRQSQNEDCKKHCQFRNQLEQARSQSQQ